MEPDLLTPVEVADLLRLRLSTIRSWILQRRVPYIKMGGRVFFRKIDLLELIESSRVPAQPGKSKNRNQNEAGK